MVSSSEFSSSFSVQDQDMFLGHPGCHISLTLTAASIASHMSPGMLPPGSGVCMCVCVSVCGSERGKEGEN